VKLSHAAAILLAVTLGAFASGPVAPSRAEADPKPAPPDEKIDIAAVASPTRPLPAWLKGDGKFIDQGANDKRLKGYKTPEGIKVEIVADAPAVVNPVGMTFALDGTPYVMEWLPSPGDEWRETPETIKYKDGTQRKIATMKKRVPDNVKTLASSKQDGVYDKATVILRDELPSSILLHDGWLYLTGRGTVRRFKQSKPGGPYDVKEIVAQGFCGFHHHQVSGLTLGNDGWLYITSGDDDNYVEGSDGSRATVLRTGAVFRCRPDGSQMQAYAMGFRNPYRDVAFDTAFNMFHVDNDNEDGSKFTGCRLMHVAEGSDFGWRLRIGARCCVPDAVRGAVYGELPGKVPPLLKTGRGSPAGLLIYNDTYFPENYRGLLFYPDVFRKLIRAYRVEKRGASFVVADEFEFMKSDDPLFRPCEMVLGPDGAMYIVDWRTDSGGAGRLWGDGEHGRIYRVTWGGTKETPAIATRAMDSWEKITKLDDDELLKALASENMSDRTVAQREVVHRGEKQRPALLKMLLDVDQPKVARIAALGALQSFWDKDVQDAFLKVLKRGDADLRRLAADGLGLNAKKRDDDAHLALQTALADDEPEVRRSAALAMGRVGGDGSVDALVKQLEADDGKDVVLLDGYVRAVESLGKPGIQGLIELADSGVAKDRDRVVAVFTMLRTRPAAEALPTMLKNVHLSDKQRADLLRSYNNYLLDPPVSVEPALEYLLAHPKEPALVQLAGLEVLSMNNALKGDKAGDWLLALLDETDPNVRVSVLKAIEETKLNKAAPRLVKMLADTSRSAAERQALVKALRTLTVEDKSATARLKEIVADTTTKTEEANTLRIESLRTLAVLDRAEGVKASRAALEKYDAPLVPAAVQILGDDADGARFAAKLYLDKKLPRELLAPVSDALRKHSEKNQDLAKMLTEVMKSGLLVSNTPEEVSRVRKLVETKGDAKRGRTLYLDGKKLACITCHRLEGVGGNVGPDLTRVWETQSIEKIMESLIEPSKEIKEGYQAYQATTKKGQTYTGLKISQSADEVVLRDANARDIRIPVKDLDDLTASKVSLMPDNVIAQLSYDQFIDLVAFLKSRTAQESLRGLALDFDVAGPYGGELKTAYEPETKPDAVKWRQAFAEPTGYLDLRKLFDRDDVSSYMVTHVYSAIEQKATMLLGSDDSVRVWIDGKLVHENPAMRSARPDEDRVTVTLKPGWNRVLVKVVNGTADHGLYLRFAGEGLRVSRLPVNDK
jgi:putative membrane-bound dehydrogenase-like protein